MNQSAQALGRGTGVDSLARRRQLRPFLTLGAIFAAGSLLACAAIVSFAVTRLDLLAVQAAHGVAAQPLTGWSLEVTSLGGTPAIIAATGAALALLWAHDNRRGALALAAAVSLTEVTVEIAKVTVARPRPPAVDAWVDAAGFSFPSGHAAASMALYGTLAFLMAQRLRRQAQLVIALAAAALVLAIGSSRVYLGVHYPSDVVAGWLVGSILAVTSLILVGNRAGPSATAPARGT